MPDQENPRPVPISELDAIRAAAREAIISTTPDGVVTAWNPAAELTFGYKSREILGKPFAALVPVEDLERELLILESVRGGERTEDYQTRRIQKGGGILDVSVTFAPIRDDGGRVAGVLMITVDITQRKRLEAAELDLMFLASIIASAEDSIISKDLNGIVTSWNRSAQRLFGYTAEEMIGHSIDILVPPDQPDEEQQILQRIRRGERIEHYETRRRRKNGSIIEVSVTISPIVDRLGRAIGASQIARDITDRKRWLQAEAAESFLGAIVESAEDAILSKNLNGIVTTWNPAAERLYGYRADEIVGKPITLLIPEDHPDEEAQILKRIRRGERIQHYETRRRRKDGGLIDVAQTISPIRDNLGNIIGVSNITRDITEQQLADRRERDALRQAQEARRMAEEASRAKDDFLATISHELRTPMTAILGWSRMLLSGQLPAERQRQAIETIDRNARSQAQLIEDLLDVSRIVSGRLRIEFRPVDLAGIVSAAVETARPSAEAKRIFIRTVLSSGAGPVLGDPERLQQVVWNLLSNAIRFTPKDGLVQIFVERVESQVEIRVVDNGIGVKPEFLPHLFERFTQGEGSATESRRGLGMGLAIVKSLVEVHGGVVSASSEGEGKGATFAVKLPICAVRKEPPPHVSEQQPVMPAGARDRDELVGIKVLVVDDDPDTCELLKFVFNQTGAIVQAATNAEHALELFDSWNPDILVSDIGLPEIDGYELVRIIREQKHSRIPAVALTAMARIDDRVKALNAGYQMHIAKPVQPVELISIVSSLVALVNRRPDPQ